jgi:signal transduction histidine kinase
MKARDRMPIAVFALVLLAQTAAAQVTNLWRTFTRSDGLAENACLTVSISPGGKVIVGHPKAAEVTLFDGYDARRVPAPPWKGRVFESSGGQLWTVTPRGMAEFREGMWLEHAVAEIAAHFEAKHPSEITLLPILHGRVLVLLPERLLRVDIEEVGQSQVKTLRVAEECGLQYFTAMTPARDGGLWISGSTGIGKLAGPLRSITAESSLSAYIPSPALGLADFRVVCEDSQDAFSSLATSQTGGVVLALYEGLRWKTRAIEVPGVRYAWRCGKFTCGVTADSMCRINQEGAVVGTEEIPARRICDFAIDPGGAVWLATTEGLFRKAPGLWAAVEFDEMPVELKHYRGRAWNLRQDGRASRDWIAGFPELKSRDTIPPVVLSNKWDAFLKSRKGDLWLGGPHLIAWFRHNAWKFFSSTNDIGPENVFAFAESPEGRVWCATPGRIWSFDGHDWLVLRGGFSAINDLLCTVEGSLWVATDDGLHRFWRGNWTSHAPQDGLSSTAVQALLEDRRGSMWARGEGRAFRFTPQADPDPPRTFIRTPGSERHEFFEGDLVAFAFEGRDKWNLSQPEQLLFSFRIDERDWTPFNSTTGFSFADLPIGKHYFQVRAMDRNGNIDPRPARFEFAVVVPWYKETRLVMVLSAALAVAVCLAGIAVNRHRRLRLSYAEVERIVAERTRELELANRELLHSQKMNALGTLAAGIAHDFNNILSIIKGSAQIIEENPGNTEKIRTRLDRIKTVVQQGAGIVEAMLGFSRSSDQGAPCDINAVVEDTVRLLGDRFVREVEIRMDRAQDLPAVLTARDFLQQVLLNFIFNAAEAMTGGKKQVLITTRKVEKSPCGVVLAPRSAQEYVAVSVTDFGCGITPENLPRIFEPFFTTKAMSARRGTGLGLSMVYELALKMEAGLAVETRMGSGSTFTLLLPVKK